MSSASCSFDSGACRNLKSIASRIVASIPRIRPEADGKALGHFPVIGINSHTIRIIIEPFIRFAISRHKTLDHVTALRQCLGVDDVNADGLTMRQRRVAAAGDQSYLALVERIKPEWRRRPAHVHLA